MLKVVARHMDSLAVLVDMVRDFLEADSGAESRSEQLAFDLDLVLEELFTNIVRHGRGTGSVEVELSPDPGGVRVVLRADEPVAHDPTQRPAVNIDLPPEQRSAGGLGVHFVRELSRQFDYQWNDGIGTTTVVVGVRE